MLLYVRQYGVDIYFSLNYNLKKNKNLRHVLHIITLARIIGDSRRAILESDGRDEIRSYMLEEAGCEGSGSWDTPENCSGGLCTSLLMLF